MKTVNYFMQCDKRTAYKHLSFISLLICVSIFLIWKCKYGFGNVDESFYLTVPYRLYKGDALFLHEWHLSQMSGVLTYPFVSLYLGITGGTTGLVLFMRYLCTVFQIFAAVFIYIRFHKINWLGALVSSLSYVLYIPFGIMALSYNSMAIMALVISMVIVITAQKHIVVQYIISGLFYAFAVLCCPYLAFVFIGYLLVVAVMSLIRKRMRSNGESEFYFLTIKGAVYLSIGAVIAAIVFTIFVLSRASLTEIIKAFPEIMNDPEHPPVSLAAKIKSYISIIIFSNRFGKYIYPIIAILACVCLFDRKRYEHKLIYVSIAAFFVTILMGEYYRMSYINFVMWPLNILTVFIILLSKDKTKKNIFCSVWIVGILYSFCVNATSNQEFYVISSGSAVSLVGSIMIICSFLSDLMKENKNILFRRIVVVVISGMLVLQIFMQCSLRYRSVFCEKDMASQNTLIEDGFNAGLYVTEEKHKEYYDSLESLKKLEKYSAENVLYLSKNTWYYLVYDYNMSTYSAWLSGVTEFSVSRLESYYEINPDKLPDVVYVDSQYKDAANYFCDLLGYKIDDDIGAIILIRDLDKI